MYIMKFLWLGPVGPFSYAPSHIELTLIQNKYLLQTSRLFLFFRKQVTVIILLMINGVDFPFYSISSESVIVTSMGVVVVLPAPLMHSDYYVASHLQSHESVGSYRRIIVIVTVTLAALLDFSHITTYLSTSESLETLHLRVIDVAVVELMLEAVTAVGITKMLLT